MPYPLLPSRHEGKDTRSHAVQRTSDDIPSPTGSVALYTDKITTSYHQHNTPFSLYECVRIAHHYRINLGWSHKRSAICKDVRGKARHVTGNASDKQQQQCRGKRPSIHIHKQAPRRSRILCNFPSVGHGYIESRKRLWFRNVCQRLPQHVPQLFRMWCSGLLIDKDMGKTGLHHQHRNQILHQIRIHWWHHLRQKLWFDPWSAY